MGMTTKFVKLAKRTKASAFKATKTAQVLDKNSKTMVKISQLLEVLHSSESYNKHSVDVKNVRNRIEILKRRVRRRLVMMAKWSDTALEDRRPESRSSLMTAGTVPFGTMGVQSGASRYQPMSSAPQPMARGPYRVNTGTPAAVPAPVHVPAPIPAPASMLVPNSAPATGTVSAPGAVPSSSAVSGSASIVEDIKEQQRKLIEEASKLLG